MNGLRFDFGANDIILQEDGTFVEDLIDSQTCALISLSQVCRITRPNVGTQIGSKIIDGATYLAPSLLADAERAVRDDGGKNVSVILTKENQLQFLATYAL